MRLVRYNLRSHRQSRSLDNIIDWDNSSYRVDQYTLIGAFKTKVPHLLITGEELLVSLNDITYTAKYSIGDEYLFSFEIQLREKLSIMDTRIDSNGQVALLLETPLEHHVEPQFGIYNELNELVFSDCNFYKKSDGTILYGAINIPKDYYTGIIVDENYGPLYVCDDRAFSWEQSEIFNGTTSIMTAQQHLCVRFPLSQENNIGLGQDDLYTNLMETEIRKTLVDDAPDMEKQVFEPYEISGENYTRISEIDFHIHCRQRNADNNWKIITTGTTMEQWWHLDDADAKNSDELSYLGFEDDDIKFQKSRLKKSFLRLSFYDSTDRLNQNLLAYTTIFYDTNTAYSTWNKNHIKISTEGDVQKNQLERIDATFSVTDRYNYTASSDGFYIYLYPDQLLKTSGDTIYMKVDFNNAKYGKTVNLALPRNDSGDTVIFSASSELRTSYLRYDLDNKGNPTELYTDTQAIARDLYAEVKIGYNEAERKYTYSFPWAEKAQNGVWNIHFFEPKGN